MFQKRALPFILTLFCLSLWADTPVTIRRICEEGRNNHIYFTPSNDPCGGYFQYKIWGRDGNSGPFSFIDSILIKNQDEYIHIDASPGIATNWSYYILIIDSCGPDYASYSDTVAVDRQQPQIITLDSVSINPITNTPILGWKQNPSPDFSHFKVYLIEGTNTLVSPAQKDTFFNYANTVTGPITFNISSVDSCGNETPFIIGRHTSMFLTHTIDTCLQQVQLTWTPYIGWLGIRSYHIFQNTNNLGYVDIDSTTANNITIPIVLGSSYTFYIRAFENTQGISASSNSISFTTRFRAEPNNSFLSVVSVTKPDDKEVEIHIYNPNEEVKQYRIQTSPSLAGAFTTIGTISGGSSFIQNYSLLLPFNPVNKYYRIIPMNDCDINRTETNTSRYSSLYAESNGNQNIIYWERYFQWNSGVDYYNIYRGTNDPSGNIIYSLLGSVNESDTFYIDDNLPPTVGESGLCYYVEAVQMPGDINPSIESSFSIRQCVVGDLLVFIPNAFSPSGVNTVFRPEGSYIDYDLSQMDIYNQWGQHLIHLNGIRNGWDGKDSDGVLCMQGVYLYQLKIISTNGQTEEFKGTVTLLN